MADTLDTIIRATRPEDLFGTPTGTKPERLASVKRRYRDLARGAHPDHVAQADRDRATQAFAILNALKGRADAAIMGTLPHSAAPEPVVVASARRTYVLQGTPRTADMASLYPATFGASAEPALLKVASTPGDNDLLASEASILAHLHTPDRPEAVGFGPMLPSLIESFDLQDTSVARRVNVFTPVEGFYSLETVKAAFPHRLDARHMAWIWRQILLVLGYAHARGVVHGAVLPHHILIHPSHDLLLADWCASVRDPHESGTHIPAMSDRYADWYPPEVPETRQPSAATDIFMSSRCMMDLLGSNVEPRLKGFLESCLFRDPFRRPQDAWALRDEFTRLIESLWGPRRRIPFTLPTQTHN